MRWYVVNYANTQPNNSALNKNNFLYKRKTKYSIFSLFVMRGYKLAMLCLIVWQVKLSSLEIQTIS